MLDGRRHPPARQGTSYRSLPSNNKRGRVVIELHNIIIEALEKTCCHSAVPLCCCLCLFCNQSSLSDPPRLGVLSYAMSVADAKRNARYIGMLAPSSTLLAVCFQ